ncbi:MAG: cbb3-type cytochrome c oxidase subunit 3 [Sphingopyxis sp.]|jgi:cytochrome c oxidase cbb3-type subunit 4|nr:cbb3-type cytochrome c oxidase subunit 3 [Sphingopyxis sp.]
MSPHSTYDMLRHLADSWGLAAMLILFLVLASWPFRPGAAPRNRDAATRILEEDDHHG